MSVITKVSAWGLYQKLRPRTQTPTWHVSNAYPKSRWHCPLKNPSEPVPMLIIGKPKGFVGDFWMVPPSVQLLPFVISHQERATRVAIDAPFESGRGLAVDRVKKR